MTPKEKAEELLSKFVSINLSQVNELVDGIRIRLAKECALMAVDEIIDAIDWHEYEVPNDQLKFWFEVKQEIEKL